MKKIPLRMCIVCRNMKPKEELIRVVKDSENNISIDKTFKAQGRGAYICNNAECLSKCRKTKALNKTYKCNIDEKNYSIIEEYLSNITNN